MSKHPLHSFKLLYSPLKEFRGFLKGSTRPLLSSKFLYPPLLSSKSRKLRLSLLLLALTLLGAFVLKLTMFNETSAAWFNDSWGYRKAITFGNSGAADSNKKVKFDIDTAALITAGKLQADCGDARFTDPYGIILRYYLDSAGGACNTSSTDFYVLFPTIDAGTTTLYHYYGNPAAANGTESSQFSESTFSPNTGPTTASEEYSPAPALYFKFDEVTGSTAYDSGTNKLNGTLGTGSSAPTWKTKDECFVNGCLTFDGSNDYVSIGGTSPSIQSVSFWVKPNTTTQQFMELNTSANISASSGTVSATGFDTPTIYVNGKVTSTITANDWSHVIVTTETAITASNIKIGRVGTTTLGGSLDEVKMYPNARSAAEVKQDYASRGSVGGVSAQLGGSDMNSKLQEGLVGWWKMDESSANTCTGGSNDSCDSSGNTNNGAWNGNVGTGSTGPGKFGNGTSFDGIGDYVSISDSSSLSPTGGLTFSTWFKPNTTFSNTSDTIQGIADKGSFHLYMDGTDGKAKFQVNDATPDDILTSFQGASAFSNAVSAMTIYNDKLYIGGSFLDGAGDPDCDRICMWDGSTWSWPTGRGLSSDVLAFAVYNGQLYVGGAFTNGATGAADADADYIALWDGADFSWPTGRGLGNDVQALTVHDNQLYVGGAFINGATGASDADADFIALWDGADFSWPTDRGLGSVVYALVVWNDQLYAGGNFTDGATGAADADADRIALWDGADFSWPTGRGLNSAVRALTVHNNQLYVGGQFTNGAAGAADADADYIALWDGADFSWPTGRGLGSYVYVLTTHNGQLYAGGLFTNGATGASDADADFIALWDGADFSWPTGSGLSTTANSLVTWNGTLYIGTDAAIQAFGTNTNTSISSTTSTYTAGSWYNITGTYDRDKLRIYVNGQLESETTSTPTALADTAGTLLLGQSLGSQRTSMGDSFLSGSLDDTRIYNRALDPREVEALYNWAPGPVGYWKMDDNSGAVAIDSSGNGNTSSTFTGNTTWVQGKFGSGLTFDGDDDVVRVVESNAIDLGATTDSYTVSAWVKTSAEVINAGGTTIAAKRIGGTYPFRLMLTGTTELPRFIIADGSNQPNSTGTTALNDGKWHFVTGVRNVATDTIYLYVDGILVDSDTDTTTASMANSQDVSFGNDGTSYVGNDFQGEIDDVKIYNYSRTPSQIIEDMNAGHPAPGSPVGSATAHWKFDEGYGTTTNNSGSAGSVINATLGTGSSAPSWSSSGKLGRGLDFSSPDYISVPSNSSINWEQGDTYTITAWVNPDSVASTQKIFNKQHNVPNEFITTLSITSGAFRFTAGKQNELGNHATDTSAAPTDTWSHIAGVNDGTQVKLYVNGVLKATTAMEFSGATVSTATLYIGKFYNDTEYFDGKIDEIKVYNADLSADQIKMEYNQGKSLVLGSLSTGVGGTAPSWGNDRSYCVPGDNSMCNPPVAEWKMDEGSGTLLYDTSGNNNSSSTFTGSIPWTTGKYGSGLSFDGTNDVVRIPETTSTNIGAIGESYSASVWFKTTTNYSDYGYIVIKDDQSGAVYPLRLGIDPGERPTFQIGDGSFQPEAVVSATVTDGKWHQLVGVRDVAADFLYLYLDGRRITSATDTTTGSTANDDDISIGNGQISYIGADFQGSIDEARIYNYARTPAQVAWEYNQGAPVAWYKFDECSGTTINDWGPNGNGGYNGNTGTLTIGGSGDNDGPGTCISNDSSEAWFNGVSGKFNASMDFDGIDDSVSVTNVSALDLNNGLATSHTFSAWIYANSDGENDLGHVYSKNANSPSQTYLRVAGESGGRVNIEAGLDLASSDATVSISVPITINTWNHIAVLYTDDGDDEIEVYINGKLRGTSTDGSGAPTAESSNLIIGSNAGGDRTFNGKIDDFRIFNYALTPAQVKEVMNNGAVSFR